MPAMTHVSTTRLENRCSGIIGSVACRSTRTNSDEPDSTTAASVPTSGSVQPSVPPTSRPMTSEPIVTASSSAPATSSFAWPARERQVEGEPADDAGDRGERNVDEEDPRPRPLFDDEPADQRTEERGADEREREVADVPAALRGGRMSPSTANASAWIAPPPKPWTARAPISWFMLCDSPHRSEPTMNSPSATCRIDAAAVDVGEPAEQRRADGGRRDVGGADPREASRTR